MSGAERVLIVNADDLGRTAGINEGVFAAHREGVVSSATLMVGYEPAVEAAREARTLPGLGIGLHVALTGGRSLLPPDRLPSLVDAEGRQPLKPEGLRRPEAGEVLAEVEAQLALFYELMGRAPTHLDSHHHSHRLPAVREALIEVAQREAIPVRRASSEVAQHLERAGVASTDFFVDEFFGDSTQPRDLLRILGGLRHGSTELMCHPARVDEELRSTSGYADERSRELETLSRPEMRLTLEIEGIRLTHFGAL